MRRMCDSAAGPRLSSPARRLRARRAVRVAARVAEAGAVLALFALLVLAARLSHGPIYLQTLHDKIASSLQERVGDRYAIDLGPTYLMHDDWGVGLGFRNLTVRDAAGRTVLAAPAGKIGLDTFALLLAQVKVRRLQLNGLALQMRVAADGALSIAVSGDESAAPIALPSGPSGLGSLNIATLVRAGAQAMAGAGQAVDQLTLANGRFRDRQRGDAPVGDLQGLQTGLRPVRRRGDRQALGHRAVGAVGDRESGDRRRCARTRGRSA